MISSYMGDFIQAGTVEFMKEITEKIKEKLDFSKLEDDELRFAGINVKKEGDVIVIRLGCTSAY